MTRIITPQCRHNGGGFTEYGKYIYCRKKPNSRQLFRQPSGYPMPITDERHKKPSQRFDEAAEKAFAIRDRLLVE